MPCRRGLVSVLLVALAPGVLAGCRDGGEQAPPRGSATAQPGRSAPPPEPARASGPGIRSFVPIEPGSFWMGSPSGLFCPFGYTGGGCKGDGWGFSQAEPGRGPSERLHFVRLTVGYEMLSHEVTQAEFRAQLGYDPSSHAGCDRCPVERVSWHEALAYANALSRSKGIAECFDCTGEAPDFQCALKATWSRPQDCPGYRLPTEAEWEHAYRAGSSTALYPSPGNDGTITVPADCAALDPNADAIGWYCANAGKPYDGSMDPDGHLPAVVADSHEAGLKAPNAWGLYDMAGNVFEWCWDGYDDYEPSTFRAPLVDPVGEGKNKVERGGNMSYVAKFMRGAYRDPNGAPSSRYPSLGFRIVRTLRD